MIDDSLISIYMERFINRSDVWGMQYFNWKGEWTYTYQKPDLDTRFRYEPISPDLIRRHLAGEITCAWVATSSTGESKWLCFDSDEADGELDNLAAFLSKYGWRFVREGKRPGRDGHLWLFFDRPIPAKTLMRLGDLMIKLAGVRKMERFPKTERLSQVRGPLGIHLKPDANRARGWFEGPEQDVKAQLEWLALQPVNKAAHVIAEVEKHTAKNLSLRKKQANGKKSKDCRKHSINILDYVNARPSGHGLIAQCPLCASEGHDSHCDNLHISADGKLFCCVYGGPAAIHKTGAIAHYMRSSH